MGETNVSDKTKKSAIIVVAIAIFTDMLIYGLVVPILPKYATTLGASQTAIGFLFSSYAIALFIATPIFGALSDRIGRRGPMIWGLLGLGVATLMFAFADSFGMLVAARVLQGISAAITWTAGLALLADLFPSEERGKVMGLALSGQAAGILLGPTIGGWLYQLGDYRLPFFVAAGLAIIDGILRLVLVKDVPHAKSESTMSPFKVLGNRQLLIVTGVILIGACVPSVLEPTLPLHLQDVLGATPGVIGLLFAVPTLAYGLATPFIGIISTKVGHIKTIIIGLIMVTIFLPLVALPTSIWVQVIALAMLGLSMGTVLTPCLPQLADIAEKSGINSYGVTFAMYNTAYSAGMMMGPIAGSIIADSYGLNISFLTIGIVVFAYMILFSIQMRKRKNNNHNVDKTLIP